MGYPQERYGILYRIDGLRDRMRQTDDRDEKAGYERRIRVLELRFDELLELEREMNARTEGVWVPGT